MSTARSSPRCAGTGQLVPAGPEGTVIDCPVCFRPVTPRPAPNGGTHHKIASHGTVRTASTDHHDEGLRWRQQMQAEAAGATLRHVRIHNVYEELPEVVITERYVVIPGRDTFDGTDAEYADYVRDEVLHPITGIGHETGNSGYELESIDGLEPELHEEWF